MAKANFVHPMTRGDCGEKHGQRKERESPRFFAEHRASDAENIARDFGEAAVIAVDASAVCAKAGEKLLDSSGPGNFGVSERDSGECVRIAAGNLDFSVGFGEFFRFEISVRPHLAVARFEGRSIGDEPFEIFELAAASESGENVIDAEEDFAFGEVHQERDEIGAALLNFDVVAFGDGVDAEVEFGARRHRAGDFFTEEEVRPGAKGFGGVNAVVVGHGDDGHTQALAAVIDVLGVIIGFTAEVADERRIAHPRSFGMDVKVAAHGKSMAVGYEQSMKR